MIESPDRRITPWVGRILAINAIVLLLQETIFTSTSLADLISFDPSLALQRPWTFVTYMFVHGGIFHLAANSLALFVFGPTVEQRFGSRLFLAYYFLCGVGAGIFALILRLLGFNLESFVGASGAILGVAYAYARLMPDAQLMVFPIPAPIRARYLILFLAAYDVLGLFLLNDHIAHEAHLGGLLTGVTFFLLRSLGRPLDTLPMPSIRRRVPVTTRSGSSAGQQPLITPHAGSIATPALPEEHPAMKEAAELDRVLDKISATGIGSLTATERQFLDAMARRRKNLH